MSKIFKALPAVLIVLTMLACDIQINIPATTASAPPPIPTTAVPPPVHSDWLTYTNTVYGFEFKYPPDSTLSDETESSVRIQLSVTPGTNLGEKYLDVSAAGGASSCSSPQAQGYAPGSVATHPEIFNSLPFTVESAADAGAGNIYEWTGYSTLKGSTCVSLTFVLHSTNPGMYETPPPVFDDAAESAIFAEIVSTFTWLNP